MTCVLTTFPASPRDTVPFAHCTLPDCLVAGQAPSCLMIFVFCSWFFISLVSCLTDAYSSCRCLPDSGVTSSQRPALTAIANLLPVTILSLMIAPSSFPFLHLHNLFVQLFLRTPQGASPSRVARHLEANTVNTS